MDPSLLNTLLGQKLLDVDRYIDQAIAPRIRYTLAPERERAHSLYSVYQCVIQPQDSPEIGTALAQGLCEIALAQLENFPENLFWDYDYLAIKLIEKIRDSAICINTHKPWDKLIHVHCLYGQKTSINFRYVHDFIYGFDWAKWVLKNPEKHEVIGPFDGVFIQHMEQRGLELLALIEQDDAKYPKLGNGQTRNPFGFSRQPCDELLLYRRLASKGLIPVAAWSTTAKPQWQSDYAQLRNNEASALGLT